MRLEAKFSAPPGRSFYRTDLKKHPYAASHRTPGRRKAQADFFEAASARSRTADAAGYTMDAQKTAILGFMALMLENGDDFRLLFFCSDGSSLAGFKNGLVRSLADTLRDWVGRISPQTALPELFYRSVAGFYIGAVEQILLDGNVMKNAGLQMDAFLKFVYGGWSTILNQ
jgi:hypothetical protein